MRRAKAAGVTTTVLALLAAAGCAAAPEAPATLPVVATVTVDAGPNINPDSSGRASPVFLRIFALRDAVPLMTGDFVALAADDPADLASSIVLKQTLSVRPGARQEFTWQLEPGIRALGALAEFRDPDSSTWRASADLGPGALESGVPLRFIVRLDGSRMWVLWAD